MNKVLGQSYLPVMVVGCQDDTRARVGIAGHPRTVHTEQHHQEYHNKHYKGLQIPLQRHVAGAGLAFFLLGGLSIAHLVRLLLKNIIGNKKRKKR